MQILREQLAGFFVFERYAVNFPMGAYLDVMNTVSGHV
jgi:hypothetical protein